ncbi:MAG: hypothetical protein HY690_08875 [Chloroflexi bacterium]|nr:hypothetical protein [Chloroflexota bacterium]
MLGGTTIWRLHPRRPHQKHFEQFPGALDVLVDAPEANEGTHRSMIAGVTYLRFTVSHLALEAVEAAAANLEEPAQPVASVSQMEQPGPSVRERLRTDEAFRRQFLKEAMVSMAFEGQDITWEEALESLEKVLSEPPVRFSP